MKNYDETTDQITLTLDDDSELLCDVIATFPAKVNGKEQMYIALLPTDATPDSEIFLYRFLEDGEEIDLQNIEDDEEFEIVGVCYEIEPKSGVVDITWLYDVGVVCEYKDGERFWCHYKSDYLQDIFDEWGVKR